MRSLLFVPADSERKLEKALEAGADVLLIDLEDSVAPASKVRARQMAAEFLQSRPAGSTPKLHVRINAFDTGLADADLDAVVAARPDGILLPKSGAGADVTRLGAKLAVREAETGIAGEIPIIAIITETGAGTLAAGSYRGASNRLRALAWGAEDLSADLGASENRGPDGRFHEVFRLARALTLLGAAAAGVAAVDTVYVNFRDEAGLARECAEAARDGFTAKMAIHPAQVPIINAAFQPSPEAVSRAQAIVAAFAGAGDVGVVGLDGEMVDRPHLRRSERILERARAAGLIV